MAVVPNLADVARAIANALENSEDVSALLSARSKSVGVNRFVNTDPNLAPWCGVYLRGERVQPNSLPRGWRSEPRLSIVTQAASRKDDEATAKLEALNVAVIEALLADIQANRTLDVITDLDINYTYLETDRDQLNYQMAVITITGKFSGQAAG